MFGFIVYYTKGQKNTILKAPLPNHYPDSDLALWMMEKLSETKLPLQGAAKLISKLLFELRCLCVFSWSVPSVKKKLMVAHIKKC